MHQLCSRKCDWYFLIALRDTPSKSVIVRVGGADRLTKNRNNNFKSFVKSFVKKCYSFVVII